MDDLYEARNLYLVINNLHNLGGLAQKHGFKGPAFGGRRAVEQEYHFDEKTLQASNTVIPKLSGTNTGASQAGMTAPGTARDIRLEDEEGKVIGTGADESALPHQSGTNKFASQKGMTAPGTGRDIRLEDEEGKVIGTGADESVNPKLAGTNKFASQAGMTAPGTGRDIRMEDVKGKEVGIGAYQS